MPPRYQARPTDLLTRVRNEMDALGRPGMAGTSRLGGNRGRGFGQASVVADGTQENDDASASARRLALTVTAGTVAAGGAVVPFDTIVSSHGFDGVADASDGYWVHPVDGTYGLVFQFEWDSYTGGGEAGIEVDGILIPGGDLLPQASTGRQGFGFAFYDAEAGSVGAIRLTHTSDSTETCSGSVQLAITDPDVIEPTPEWVQVYDGAVWGLVNDGTNWWTTEGDNGQTVSKRDADWDELTTFEADAVGGGSNTTRGITFDGSDLWVTGDEEAYARYSTAGSLEVTRSLTGWSGELRVRDIAWDGTDLWIGGGDTNRVRRWSTAGVVQQTIVLGFSPTGIAFHDGRLFIANGVGASEIVVYETDGTQVTTIDVSGSGINPHGIWIDTDGTLYIARDDSGVYRRTEKVSV